MTALNHKYLIKFYELDEDNHNYYVIMEVVNGGELFDRIVDSGRLTEKVSSRILAQVNWRVGSDHDSGFQIRNEVASLTPLDTSGFTVYA